MIDNFKKFYRGKKILVTGGGGFIGSYLTEKLIYFGARVIVLEKPGTNLWRINKLIKKIKIVNLDLNNSLKLKEFIAVEKPIIFFNSAACLDTRQTIKNFNDLLKENFVNTLNLLEAAAEVRPEKFIQIGTMEEYGAQKAPFRESQREIPISSYSLTKTMATHLVSAFHKLTGLRACVVRPAAVFGPRQGLGTFIPNLIMSCLYKKNFDMNSGSQLRDFIYVEDLVEGILAAGFYPDCSSEIINLGSSRFLNIKEVANKINRFLGARIKINFGKYEDRPLDNRKFYMNSLKAKKLLNWHASTKFDEALLKTIQWYHKNRDLISKIYGFSK